jgi:nucleoside-diphosphate-sugar epimerase
MKSTLIIGCGALGQNAINHYPKSMTIHAVSRSPATSLDAPHVTWYGLDMSHETFLSDHHTIKKLLFLSRWVNFWLPPSCENYLPILRSFLHHFGSEHHLTFISSTSVFGNNAREIYEQTSTDPQTNNAKILVEAEQLIQKTVKHYHIIRLAGLLDEKRHPVYSLSKQAELKDPEMSVNLIHSEDAVLFAYHLAHHPKLKKQNIVTNLASYTHLPKAIFYQRSATQKNLPFPDQDNQLNLSRSSRIIHSEFLWPKYKYQLKHLHVE